MADDVANPYRAAIQADRGAVGDDEAVLVGLLTRAIGLFDAGAWSGPRADEVYAELVDMRQDAVRVV